MKVRACVGLAVALKAKPPPRLSPLAARPIHVLLARGCHAQFIKRRSLTHSMQFLPFTDATSGLMTQILLGPNENIYSNNQYKKIYLEK